MSRLENVVGPRDLYRMTRTLVDLFLDSYDQAPKAILLDIDDTNDTTHGDQQLALFNAHYGDYGYQPLHIYEGQSGRLFAIIWAESKSFHNRLISVFFGCVHFATRMPGAESA